VEGVLMASILKQWKRIPEILRLFTYATALISLICLLALEIGYAADRIDKFGLMIGGLAGLILAAQRTKTAQRTAENAEQGQITDRFSKAVELLSSENVTTRVGGIYALKRIAEDSASRDHEPAMNTIASFIQSASPYQQTIEHNNDIANRIANGIDTIDWKAIRAPDVFAALETLSRRTEKQVKYECQADYAVEIGECNLSYFDLTKIKVTKVSIEGCNLKGSILDGAEFNGVFADGVNFSSGRIHGFLSNRSQFNGADLNNIELFDSYIENSCFDHSAFRGSHLNGATFNTCEMQCSDFSFTTIEESEFKNSQMSATAFSGSDITKLTLTSTNLQDSDFAGATVIQSDFSNSTFSNANLSHAVFSNCNFYACIFDGCSISGTRFINCNIERSLFKNCSYDNAEPPAGLPDEIISQMTVKPPHTLYQNHSVGQQEVDKLLETISNP